VGSAEANGARPSARRSKADVVDAALGILDRQGLPDVTMRRIAEVLGVQPSALYWHFPNKQTLLAAVSDRILAPSGLLPSDDIAPRTANIAGIASRFRDCLLAYRDAAELVSSSLALGLVTPSAQHLIADVAIRADVPAPLARVAASTITHYVLGYTFHEQQRMQADSLGALADVESLTPSGAAVGASATTDFHAGIGLIVLGMSVSVAGAQDRGTRKTRR